MRFGTNLVKDINGLQLKSIALGDTDTDYSLTSIDSCPRKKICEQKIAKNTEQQQEEQYAMETSTPCAPVFHLHLKNKWNTLCKQFKDNNDKNHNFERFDPRSHFIIRLSSIVRVNVVLNRTVVVDSNWCFDNLWGSHLYLWLWRWLPHSLVAFEMSVTVNNNSPIQN